MVSCFFKLLRLLLMHIMSLSVKLVMYMRQALKFSSVTLQSLHAQDTTYSVTWLTLFVPVVFCLYCWPITKTCHTCFGEWPEPVGSYNITHKWVHEILFEAALSRGAGSCHCHCCHHHILLFLLLHVHKKEESVSCTTHAWSSEQVSLKNCVCEIHFGSGQFQIHINLQTKLQYSKTSWI